MHKVAAAWPRADQKRRLCLVTPVVLLHPSSSAGLQRRSRRSHSAEASAATSGYFSAMLSSGSEVRTRNRHHSHQTFATMDRADELFFSFFVFLLLLFWLFLFGCCSDCCSPIGEGCRLSMTLESVGTGGTRCPLSVTMKSVGTGGCPLSVTLKSVVGERDVAFL